MPEKISSDWFYKTYHLLKDNISVEQWQHAFKVLQEQQSNLQYNFLLAYKALFAITVYFLNVPHFGWIFFLFVLLLTVSYMVSLWYLHNWLEVLPAAIAKTDEQLGKMAPLEKS
ncbi:MAG: hypothetical protein ACTHMM_08895 [Agriterribacter sp.]